MIDAMAALPRWNRVRVADDPTPEPMPRRSFMRRLAGVGVATIGLQALDMIGGTTPAIAARTCSTSGLSYAGFGCRGQNYATTCSNGCPRAASVSNGTFCATSSFNSRHRTCTEDRTIDGVYYAYAIRTNECWGGGYDGWRWRSSGSCGCANHREHSCNDGFYHHQTGPWGKSICQRRRCG